jgi:XTP/dITP diphosphohydrolase
MTLFNHQRLILATHNQGKIKEFQHILGSSFATITTAGALNLPEPEETGSTFVDNALLKARATAARVKGDWALADDSGLCVTTLKGDPGIYSARWAGPDKDFAKAMQRINDALGDAIDRSAYFIAVLVLMSPDGKENVFEGRVEGALTWPPRGSNGHGYDPIFVPEGETRTFAEMTDAEKNALSHRGRAVKQLLEWLRSEERGF